ncbi:4-hydroxy-tetrahydrodipicolinate synthase, chloroplastic-like [Abrus precatorius]|uniref:4-hydroxy-tetrahydrodipicolinate synthase n=1 Tax=Abrus precatorius TaxID=3816 RepID=A0A8B8JYW1_ABRPR|nr:4-hydroxy-tetrahydrodipicolinate synthase, chloroplastic-like [Abrus precatorius]
MAYFLSVTLSSVSFSGASIGSDHSLSFNSGQLRSSNMVAHYGSSSILFRGPRLPFFRSIASNRNKRNTCWKPPRAAAMNDFWIPMSSSAVKNRAWTENIRSVRLITAVKTPYLPNGQFDLDAYDNLVDMQIANGVEGILVAGTTGEGQLMTWDEQIMLIAHTVNCFGDKVKVVGNGGSNCTSEAIKATERGFAVGMNAALHINPYYGKTSLDGLLAHYNSVLSIGPVIIYNIPTRTNQDIPPSVVQTLAQSPNLVGVKECVGTERIKQYTDQGIVVWTGIDKISHDARWDFGGIGVQSVASNLIPGLMRELMFGGKNPTLNSKIMPLFDWLSQEPLPIALNTALAQLGVIKPVFRLPHVPLHVEQRKEFVNLVKQMGREHFVGEKDVQVLDDDDFVIVGRY